MKTTFQILGAILIFIAALSTPVAIITGIYQWAVVDLEFKLALWGAVKLWTGMFLCFIPGALFFWAGD